MVKNLPANVAETLRDLSSIPESGRSPGKGMATHSSILAGESHGQEPGGLQSIGSQKVEHN